jgi:hypothetical protein
MADFSGSVEELPTSTSNPRPSEIDFEKGSAHPNRLGIASQKTSANRVLENDNDDDENASPPASTHRSRGVPLSTSSTFDSVFAFRPRLPGWLVWLRDVFFGSYERYSDIPNYRLLPMISGSLVPFAILLEIPGITEHWYVKTENGVVVANRTNSPFLNAVLGMSLACATIANVALVVRFFEQRIAAMTVLAITFLSLHGTSFVALSHIGCTAKQPDPCVARSLECNHILWSRAFLACYL